MAQHIAVEHHVHKRKRGVDKYPHSEKGKRVLDYFVYVVGILMPLLTIPQVLRVWVTKETAGISLITWVVYLLGSLVWLVYGCVHYDKKIIVCNALFVLVNLLVVIGVIIY